MKVFGSTKEPEFVKSLPFESLYKEGEKISLNIACRSNPKCIFIWYKNGIELDHTNTKMKILQKSDSYSLEISSASYLDFGYYTLVAKGQNSFSQTTCYVEIPPNIGNNCCLIIFSG